MRKWLYCILLTAMVLPMVSCRRAVTVIELPAGRIAESGTEVGHHLNLNSTLSPEMIEKLRKSAILNAGNASIVPRKAGGGEE